jgi:hypothetical protein
MIGLVWSDGLNSRETHHNGAARIGQDDGYRFARSTLWPLPDFYVSPKVSSPQILNCPIKSSYPGELKCTMLSVGPRFAHFVKFKNLIPGPDH